MISLKDVFFLLV